MDYERYRGNLQNAIDALPIGEEFLVKDLFQGTDWNGFERGEKIGFGLYFKNAVLEERIIHAKFCGKKANNSAYYRRVE